MKLIKEAPLLLCLFLTGLIFTGFAAAGRGSIYKEIENNLWKEPVLTVVFKGINEEIYPWQLFRDEDTFLVEENTGEDIAETEDFRKQENHLEENNASEESSTLENTDDLTTAAMPTEVTEEAQQTEEPVEAAVPTAVPTPEPTPYSIKNQRLEPLRASTEEEYKNHISADIYGDAGVIRAAEYTFSQVDESYFDDALFIGDSRTVGLHDYTDLREHADFLCETSLTIYKVMNHKFKGMGTIEEVLAKKDYGKIYLMVGINELGRGTTEDFMAEYTNVVDKLHELEPEALIFVQGVMRVSGEKASSDKIYNNENINARNNAVATLADNIQVFYIDVNEVVCDEDGNLNDEYTYDQIHLLGVYNDIWKQFLLSHGVTD